MTLLAAAACCGAAGAASFFAAPLIPGLGEKSPAHQEGEAPPAKGESHAQAFGKTKVDDQGKAKKRGNGHSKAAKEGADDADGASRFFVSGGAGVFALRPIVVSLRPQGRVRYLKIALAVETTPESEHVFAESELRIIDFLTAYLRAAPVTVIEDPAGMARLREQIARRVAFIVDPAPVNAILITDFILS